MCNPTRDADAVLGGGKSLDRPSSNWLKSNEMQGQNPDSVNVTPGSQQARPYLIEVSLW